MTDTLACDALLRRITAGGSVTVKELKDALGDTHWRAFCTERGWAKIQRERIEIARHELRDYIRLVHLADLYDGQSGRRGKRSGAYYKLKRGTDSKYEDALERLSELISANPRLIDYLDRNPDMDKFGSLVHADKQLVPRVISSKRWVYGNVENKLISTLVELKEEALTLALQEPQASEDVHELEPENIHARANLNTLQKLVRR
jgi:hypothetical protein